MIVEGHGTFDGRVWRSFWGEGSGMVGGCCGDGDGDGDGVDVE